MRVVPAVDIRDGRCVNLVQGDYDQETVFAEDPVAQAILWRDLGGEIVHIVDLDGALEGKLCAGRELRAMTEAGIRLEVGGGIRTLETIADVIESGAERAILGTAAHRDPDLVRKAAKEFPGKIVVGIDAKAGKVALSGWKEITDTDAVDFAREMEDAGACRIIYTDILSDGMLQGPNYEATQAVAQAVSIPVTISGGVASLDNIRRSKAIEPDGVDEIIVGRALYIEAFTLPEAIAATQESG
jgi:phosphoribosylformimino-5-aminoimidazole carboxamide ribotide isomerase